MDSIVRNVTKLEEKMKVTVEDVLNFPEFKDLKLIAGKGGINNPIELCGFLDYEFMDGLREKWSNTNFVKENILAVTSFLYAKDNEYLIFDAIKRLASRKCSGIIIKNIFKLPIHENVIRYADSMNFPIMIAEGTNIHFEEIVLLVSERAKHYDSFYYRQSKVEELLRTEGSDEDLENIIFDINPSFKSDSVAMYFEPIGRFIEEDYLKEEDKVLREGGITASDSMFYYKSGFYIVITSESFETNEPEKICVNYIKCFDKDNRFRIGISSLNHMVHNIKESLIQSKYAAEIEDRTESGFVLYDKLGIYKAILPYAKSRDMLAFARNYIYPLQDYDLENRTNLIETLVSFVENGGDINKTADELKQHKNTIRYRLKNVGTILNMDIFNNSDYEVIALAIRVYICNEFII